MFYSLIPHRLGKNKEEVAKNVSNNLKLLEEKQTLLQLMKDIITVHQNRGHDLDANKTKEQRDYESLPLDNLQSVPDNSVHWCVRQDSAMMEQVSNFISTGTIIDPCADDGCERTSSAC